MASPRKSVLITGCSTGGIGAGLADVFLEKGYHVFAAVRNQAKLPESLKDTENVTILLIDLVSPESVTAAVEVVRMKTGGTLDVLVNNSGTNLFLPALDTSIADARHVFDVNFWGPFIMLQAFAPLLIEAKGCIVNNTSANAYAPMPFMGIYNSSKAALAQASETWRHELQPLGVRTITLITSAVKTDFFDNFKQAAEVPDTSYYVGIRSFITGIRDGRLQGNAISVRQYALKVVSEVDKGTTGTVWAGTDAPILRIATFLSPQWLFDMIVQSVIPISSEMAKAAKNKTA